MNPDIQPFFHADSNTWTYLVRDPSGIAAAIIDPVLDFDAKAARTSTTSPQKVVDAARERGLPVVHEVDELPDRRGGTIA